MAAAIPDGAAIPEFFETPPGHLQGVAVTSAAHDMDLYLLERLWVHRRHVVTVVGRVAGEDRVL